MKRWYVVRLQFDHEFQAGEALAQLGFPFMFPQVMRRSVWRGKVKFTPRALISGYGFTEFDRHADDWQAINRQPGIYRVLSIYDGIVDYPVPVRLADIERIQSRVAEDGYIHEDLEDRPWLALRDQAVNITRGPFTGFPAVVTRADTESIEIKLTIFNCDNTFGLDWQDVALLEHV